jgi:putative acetyltransferase
MFIRDEAPADIAAIRTVVIEAFENMPRSTLTEAAIIDRLRSADALAVSLVALDSAGLVGHVAFSPVLISRRQVDWYGLGPLAVRPDRQRRGIGDALVRSGLKRLQSLGAGGCVLVGEPEYYERFGFRASAQLRFAGVPPQYFLVLPFGEQVAEGDVQYHAAFG